MRRRFAPRRVSNNLRHIEELETRAMLSGHGLAAAEFSSHAFQAAATAHVASQFASLATSARTIVPDQFLGALSSLSGGDHAQSVLTAQLTDSSGTATGTAKLSTHTYDGETDTKLSVTVSGATADTTFDVMVGTTVAGQVTTDSSGNASVVFSSDPTGSQQAFLNVPTAAAGDTVMIGALSGPLATPTFSGGGCGGDVSDATRFATRLTDPAGVGSGHLSVSTATVDGATVTRLRVHVTGAAASTTLDVMVGDTLAGQVTTDASGAATAVFSSSPTGSELAFLNVPTASDGLAVTVGTFTGQLAPAGHGFHWGH